MDTCSSLVAEYYTYKPFHLLQWSQLLFSAASILVVSYTIVVYLRKSWFEGVFKETLYALYFFILWHAVFTIILQLIQIIARVTAKTSCEIQFDRRICILRVIVTLPFISFVWIHAAITVQRVVTSFTGNRRLHTVIARLCLLVTFACCFIYVYVAYNDYPLEGKTCYCSGFVAAKENIVIFATFVMMFMDIANVAATFMLIKYNRKKIQALSAAPLAVKFRHRQTLHSIQQMLPVAVLHIICFPSQYIGFELSRKLQLSEVQIVTFNGFFYCMPYYCFLCPLIILFIMSNERKRKEKELRSISSTTSEASAESHFTTLQSQWERPLTTTKKDRYVQNGRRVLSA